MGNISIKLNLKQLKHAQREMKGANGKKVKCLIIPIEENELFEGEKGTYIDLTAIEIKNKVGDSKDTHLVKQNFDKDVYNAMSEEERKASPILGNAILWSRSEPSPQVSDSIPAEPITGEEEDDLPF